MQAGMNSTMTHHALVGVANVQPVDVAIITLDNCACVFDMRIDDPVPCTKLQSHTTITAIITKLTKENVFMHRLFR